MEPGGYVTDAFERRRQQQRQHERQQPQQLPQQPLQLPQQPQTTSPTTSLTSSLAPSLVQNNVPNEHLADLIKMAMLQNIQATDNSYTAHKGAPNDPVRAVDEHIIRTKNQLGYDPIRSSNDGGLQAISRSASALRDDSLVTPKASLASLPYDASAEDTLGVRTALLASREPLPPSMSSTRKSPVEDYNSTISRERAKGDYDEKYGSRDTRVSDRNEYLDRDLDYVRNVYGLSPQDYEQLEKDYYRANPDARNSEVDARDVMDWAEPYLFDGVSEADRRDINEKKIRMDPRLNSKAADGSLNAQQKLELYKSRTPPELYEKGLVATQWDGIYVRRDYINVETGDSWSDAEKQKVAKELNSARQVRSNISIIDEELDRQSALELYVDSKIPNSESALRLRSRITDTVLALKQDIYNMGAAFTESEQLLVDKIVSRLKVTKPLSIAEMRSLYSSAKELLYTKMDGILQSRGIYTETSPTTKELQELDIRYSSDLDDQGNEKLTSTPYVTVFEDVVNEDGSKGRKPNKISLKDFRELLRDKTEITYYDEDLKRDVTTTRGELVRQSARRSAIEEYNTHDPDDGVLQKLWRRLAGE